MTTAINGGEWSLQRIGIQMIVKHQPDNETNEDSCNSANGFFYDIDITECVVTKEEI